MVSNQAAPELGQVEQTLAATQSQAPTNVEGLADENSQQRQQTENLVADTVLTNADASIEVTALTAFHDATKTIFKDSDLEALPVADANFVFPPHYFKVIERTLPITSITVDSTAPDAYPMYRIDVANQLLTSEFIQTKLNYPSFIRYNLEVQVKVLATNYHYGQLMCVWRPAYAKYLKAYWSELNYSSSEDMICQYQHQAWDNTGPFDHVWAASQLPHTILPITAGTSVTIKCPWNLNYQYVPTKTMLHQAFHIGYLDIYKLTPVGPTDIDPPLLQIFGRFTDVCGFGYRSATNFANHAKGSRIKGIHYYSYKGRPSGNTYSTWNCTPPPPGGRMAIKAIEGFSTSKNLKWGLISTSNVNTWHVSGYWNEVNRVREKKEIGEADAMLTGALRGVTSGAKTAATKMMAWLGSGIQTLGLSKPPETQPPTRVLSMAPPLASSVCTDFSVSTALDPLAEIKTSASDHPDATLIERLAAIPTLWTYMAFNNTNKEISITMHPGYAWYTPDIMLKSPAAYIADRFLFWRGNLHYRVHFSSSSFVNARFAIRVSYTEATDLIDGIVPTQYVEVKGDTVVEGEVPFLHFTPWAMRDRVESGVILNIRRLDRVVSWKVDQSTPIYATLWYWYTGFQVANSAQNAIQGIPWGFIDSEVRPNPTLREIGWPLDSHCGVWVNSQPCSCSPESKGQRMVLEPPANLGLPDAEEKVVKEESLQIGELPGTTPARSSMDYGMNDIPVSIYHLAKRYVHARAAGLNPFNPLLLRAYKDGEGKFNYAVTYYPNPHWATVLFRWVRGSVNVVSSHAVRVVDAYRTLHKDEPNKMTSHFLYSYIEHEEDEKASLLTEQVCPYIHKHDAPMMAVRVPFRSNVPYVSGPHCYIWYTTQDVENNYTYVRIEPMSAGSIEEVINTVTITGVGRLHAEFDWSFGDDLAVKQFMGIPATCKLNEAELRDALYGPRI